MQASGGWGLESTHPASDVKPPQSRRWRSSSHEGSTTRVRSLPLTSLGEKGQFFNPSVSPLAIQLPAPTPPQRWRHGEHHENEAPNPLVILPLWKGSDSCGYDRTPCGGGRPLRLDKLGTSPTGEAFKSAQNPPQTILPFNKKSLDRNDQGWDLYFLRPGDETSLPWDQYSAEPVVLGKGRTSRMLEIPVMYMIRRSKPRPKPA